MRHWWKYEISKTKHETHEYENLGIYFGLLTHKYSQYSKTPFIELFEKASEFGQAIKLDVKNSIAQDNPFSPTDVKLMDLLLARIYEPVLHRRWADYLVSKKTSKANKSNLRIVFNFFLYCQHLTRSDFRAKERKRYSRILNINSGYMNLLADFLNSGTPVGLIFEDDANFDSSRDLIFTLFDLVKFAQSVSAPSHFIDVSDSFSFQELGAQHLVILPEPTEEQNKFLGSSIYKTLKPFTNTTCAIIYNRNMASIILAGVKNFSSIPGKRIIPMDWTFNLILLELESSNIQVESFHLDPGIFPQNSLAHLKEK